MHLYNNVTEQIIPNGNVLFNTISNSTSGLGYNNGVITITNLGIYKISFYVQTEQDTQFAIFINDVIINGSIYSSGIGGKINVGTCTTNVLNNNTLTLKNTTNNNININIPNIGNNTSVNASLMIE
jgi:hypothetical protein